MYGLKTSYLHGYHAHLDKPAGGELKTGEIHQGEVVAILLIPFNPFVVVEKVPTAVKDYPALVELDSLGMVGGVAVNDINPRIIDKSMGKMSLHGGNSIAPVSPPMN